MHRKLKENSIWKDKPYARGQAWLDMLLLASHSRREIVYRNATYDLGPGEVITSVSSLAQRWGWERRKAKRFLSELEKNNMITAEMDNRKTRITIANWSSYQTQESADSTTEEIWYNRNPENGTTENRKTVQQKTAGKTSKDSGLKKAQETLWHNSQQTNGTTGNAKTVQLYNKQECLNKNVLYPPPIVPPLKLEDFVEYWNSFSQLPEVKVLSKSRRGKFNCRCREKPFAENWKTIIEELSCSDFHCGQNDRNWRADIDWILRNDSNYVKFIEKKNTRKTKPKKSGPTAAQIARRKAGGR